MKKLLLLLVTLSLGGRCWAASERENAVKRLDHSARVLHELMTAPDQRIPATF